MPKQTVKWEHEASADALYDVVIIGAGVVGCSLARELAQYKTDVCVLERAHDVGEGSSKANSGIIHAGFHPRGGSLKGTSCVQGNATLKMIAQELDVPIVECGALMVAFNDKGIEKLEEKANRAQKNGAGVLKIVDGDHARHLEPRLSKRVIAAMLAPSTAIISPFDLVLALAENAADNGVRFRFNSRVEIVERVQDQWLLHLTDGSTIRSRFVANMSGDDAALIDAQVSGGDCIVRPRKGEFIVFDRQDPRHAITHVIYQAAESDEGGTLLAPTVEGNLLAGPTSVNAKDFKQTGTTRSGLEHISRVAKKLIPDLDLSTAIRNFAGVRANIVNVSKELKDFVVRASASGFVSALGIKNPGMTSSPILAKRAVEILRAEGLDLEPDPSFDPKRTHQVPFLKQSRSRQRNLLAEDATYGHVVCRCENITEGDVRYACNRTLPPTTMAGVKRRLRCSMGRCQGQYCDPRVNEVLADVWHMDPWTVAYGEDGGRFVAQKMK